MNKMAAKSVVKSDKTIKLNTQNNIGVLEYQSEQFIKENLKIAHGRTKKQKIMSTIFLLLNVAIVAGILIYQFCFQQTKPLSELFAENPYWRFLFVALGCMGLFYVCEALTYSIMYKKFTGRFRFWLGLKLAIVGKYWDSLTPFGSGGQFAQVAYSNSKGNRGAVSTSVVVGKFMLWQISFILIGIIAICLPFDYYDGGNIIRWLALVGVGANCIVFVFVWLVSINKRLCSLFVVGGLKLLARMHIIKNFEKSLYSALRFVRNYQNSIKAFSRNPWLVLSEIVLDLVGLIAVASVAFCIYKMFNPFGAENGVQIVVMSFLCTFATACFPVPGGSGAAEVSFVAMFSKLFEEGESFWALLMWRFFTFYLYLILGFGMTMLEPIFHKIKHRNDDKKVCCDNKDVVEK